MGRAVDPKTLRRPCPERSEGSAAFARLNIHFSVNSHKDSVNRKVIMRRYKLGILIKSQKGNRRCPSYPASIF